MSGGVALSWTRSGLGAAITQQPGATASARAPLPLSVDVQRDGGTVATVEPAGLSVLGPGDVTGFDARQVVDCSPRPESTGVNASDLAYVELADPGLPWVVTPYGADSSGNVTPWIALVVVPDELVAPPTAGGVATITADAAELPPWAQLHAWAHVHVADALLDPTDAAAARRAVATPGLARSRLICPRQLRPDTIYRGCVVPTFAAGVDALMGTIPVTATAAPAWGTSGEVRLPVYWSYCFTTGEAETFEDLALALRPLGDDATEAASVGAARWLGVDFAGRSLPSGPPLPVGGALRIHAAPAGVSYDAAELRVERESTSDLPAPTWGAWHATEALPAAPVWLGQLNDWPPHRVVAGLGAAAVRAHQEELMAAAWEQAGQLSEMDALVRHAQAALAVGERMWRRRAVALRSAPAALLQVGAPAAARLAIAADPPRSLAGRVAQTCLPASVLGVPFRRLCRPDGALGHRLARLRDGNFTRSQLVSRYVDGRPTHAPNRADEVVRTPTGRGRRLSPAAAHIAAAVAAWDAAAGAAAAGPPPCTAADLGALADAAVAALNPTTVLPRRVNAQISMRTTPAEPAQPGEPISRVQVGPRLDVPMFDLLREQGLDWLLPGIADLPDDRIVLASPDAAVIEAFLVGANHEISRELLWRRYPASRGASVFTRFWDRRNGTTTVRDAPDLTTWSGALGSHLDPNARIAVVVARGKLFRRNPDLRIYAHQAVAGTDGPVPAPAASDTAWAAVTEQPILRALIPPDVLLFGFSRSAVALRGEPPQVPGWFMVLAEPPAGTRYGLAQTAMTGTLGSWADLAWSDVSVTGGHLDATAAPTRSPTGGPAWSARSDVLARILERPPFRLFVHASRLIPEA
jgi:hypothetical protein